MRSYLIQFFQYRHIWKWHHRVPNNWVIGLLYYCYLQSTMNVHTHVCGVGVFDDTPAVHEMSL